MPNTEWIDCQDCGETESVPPFISRPAVVVNGTVLRPAGWVSVCSAYESVVSAL